MIFFPKHTIQQYIFQNCAGGKGRNTNPTSPQNACWESREQRMMCSVSKSPWIMVDFHSLNLWMTPTQFPAGLFCLASPLTTSSNLRLPAHPHPMGPACVWNFLTQQAGKQVWEKTEISGGVPVTSSCGGARGELTPRRGRTSGVVKPACASMQPVSERNSFGQQAQNWQQTKQNKIL